MHRLLGMVKVLPSCQQVVTASHDETNEQSDRHSLARQRLNYMAYPRERVKGFRTFSHAHTHTHHLYRLMCILRTVVKGQSSLYTLKLDNCAFPR